MLKVENLHAYYGKSHILQGVDLTVKPGEIVALIGRNGVGRSTTIKAIMGLVPPQGSVIFKGNLITGKAPHDIANAGIGYVPENRDIFPTLSVRDNLSLGIKDPNKPSKWTMQDVFKLFPNLSERIDVAGGSLSGGEQQMLTICRSLMGDPELIMVDEPTEGLSPQMVTTVKNLLSTIANRGVSILLVEQKLTIALELANRVYVMGHGSIQFSGTPQEMENNENIKSEWLEV
tara:strand:- start:111 stop:806 length:696 start_codon:yes stop_codon:yes gene_type:complete